MAFLNNIFSDVARSSVGQIANKVVSTIANPVVSRLMNSGLLPGGGRQQARTMAGPSVSFVEGSTGNGIRDWKVKISVSPNSGIFYQSGSGLLDPLRETNGVVFPYTPQITVSYQANYIPQKFTHSNYNHYAYENSEVQQITITAEFTAQNQDEANYVLACIYFFRAATKMFFAESPNSGNPPPLVFLNGYGNNYFKNVPCLVTAFSHTMPAEVDYIEAGVQSGSRDFGVDPRDSGDASVAEYIYNSNQSYSARSAAGGGAGATRIPTISTLQISLQPVYSKSTLAQFNLEDFAQGNLVDKGLI